jgi:hypothetical protein
MFAKGGLFHSGLFGSLAKEQLVTTVSKIINTAVNCLAGSFIFSPHNYSFYYANS